MKQNKMENSNYERLQEIDNLYKLLKIKYPDDFDSKKAVEISNILYENGIRTYMFFDNKFDIDEIVYYVLNKSNRSKVREFPRRRLYSYDNEEISSKNIGKIIKIDDYFRKMYRKK